MLHFSVLETWNLDEFILYCKIAMPSLVHVLLILSGHYLYLPRQTSSSEGSKQSARLGRLAGDITRRSSTPHLIYNILLSSNSIDLFNIYNSPSID